MIVKTSATPTHPFNVGVTVTVDTIAEPVAFVAVKEAMSPDPLTAKPVVISSLPQLYVVPALFPVKVTAVVDVFAQSA